MKSKQVETDEQRLLRELQPFCSSDPARHYLNEPASIVLDGVRYLAASDGHRLHAARCDSTRAEHHSMGANASTSLSGVSSIGEIEVSHLEALAALPGAMRAQAYLVFSPGEAQGAG